MKLLSSPWVVMVIALLLYLAGFIGALMTHQFDIPHIEKPEPVQEEEYGIEDILEGRTGDYDWYFKTAEIDKYVEELKEREVALDERSDSLENLEAHLKVEREELDELKKEIERRHKALSDEILVIRKNEINNLRTLATSYTNLTPAASVAIFEHMDQQLVVKILALMKPDVVAQILEELAQNGKQNPEYVRRAAELSEELRLHYKEKDK